MYTKKKKKIDKKRKLIFVNCEKLASSFFNLFTFK